MLNTHPSIVGFLLTILLAGSALALSGCGDDGSTEAVLTKKQFIDRADAICMEVQEAVPKEFERYVKARGVNSYSELTESLAGKGVEDIGLPAFRSQNEAIEELGTPTGDKGETEKFLEQYEGTLDEAEVDFRVLLDPSVGPMTKVAEAAQRYGFSTCGQTS